MKPGRQLLADRHLGVLGGMHGLLHGLFVTVVMVADERPLTEAVATLEPELVVVDLSLSGGGEADLVGRLLESHESIRLVVLSVHYEPDVADRLLAAGAAGFVLTRTTAADLVPAVRAVLAGGTSVSPAARRA